MSANTDKFYTLLHQLRRNYQHSMTGTMGTCSTNMCGNAARGSGQCPVCLESEIAKLLNDDAAAAHMRVSIMASHASIDSALTILEGRDD